LYITLGKNKKEEELLKKTKHFKLLSLLCCFLLLSVLISRDHFAYAASTVPSISYTTSKTKVYTGDQFDINVNINNVTDLYGASIDFQYDPSLIKVLDIRKGSVFGSAKVNSSILQRKDSTGYISFYTSLIGSVSGINSTKSTVFVIKVQALKTGAFSLKTISTNDKLQANGNNVRIKLANSKLSNNTINYTANNSTINIGGVSTISYTGSNRYQTGLLVSKAGWNQSDYAILASGQNFPDALCAAPLAGKYNAPILLTPSKTLDAGVSAEITRLKVKTVFIIGGSSSISPAIESNLKSRKINVVRLAGQNRFETSLAIAKQLGDPKEAIVVNGLNFPDALSISAYAASNNVPILLATKDRIDPAVSNYIKSKKSITKTYIVGGTAVISSNLEKSLPKPTRFSGATRYDTNLAVLKGLNFDFSNTFVALGTDFPDALAGSAIAAKTNSPTVLIQPNMPSNVVSEMNKMKSQVGIKHLLGAAGNHKNFVDSVLFK
jgi:putative cell wall-binding protein